MGATKDSHCSSETHRILPENKVVILIWGISLLIAFQLQISEKWLIYLPLIVGT